MTPTFWLQVVPMGTTNYGAYKRGLKLIRSLNAAGPCVVLTTR